MKRELFLKTFILFFILLISSAFLNKSKAQADPVIYLEWVDNPLKSMVVNWIDDPGGSMSVEYREVGSGSWSSENGESMEIPGSSKKLYRVFLEDLSAGTSYEFRVAGNNEVHKFRTAPNSLDEPIRFVVGGDILDSDNPRNDFENAKDTFEQISQHVVTYNPYFAVLAGDLAHADGKEEFVNQWFDFFELWQDNMETEDGFFVPIAATPGNHEVPNGYGDNPSDAVYYYTFFSYPQERWNSKISYGTLDFSDYLSVVTLDTDHTHRIPGTQTSWLNNTLKNRRNFRHVIPAYHVAGWPAFRTLVGIQEDLVRNNWHKVFRDNDIRLVFEHHDHVYKRTTTIGDCEDQISNYQQCEYGSQAKDGVVYMGGGAWGSENSRSSHGGWYLDKTVEEVHNFVVVEIANNYRTATAVGENGQEIDSFTDYIFLPKPKSLPADAITENSFTARWEKVEGATNYRIDVATEPDFTPIWGNNKNKPVGDTNEFELENLDPTKIYYYRVRAENVLTKSGNSEVMPVQLIIVDPEVSSVRSSEDVVEADEDDSSTITVTVIDEDGELVSNFPVTIFTEEGNLLTKDDRDQTRTNEDGEATFNVINDRAEVVTYGALAGTVEVAQKVEVTFIPRSPVALSASDVKTEEFTANWEVVNDTDYYVLDVATNESFTNFVPGYEGLDVGKVTSASVNGVNPGTEYFYRVRAVTDNLVGANSQVISTVTFPETPVSTEPNNETVVSFNANWDAAAGAQNYRLDVSRDSNFETFVDGYKNLNVDDVVSYKVEDLLPSRDYYYRVRSEAGPRLSEYSSTKNASTLEIDIDNSKIESAQLRVLANGEQPNEIQVTILATDGSLQEGVNVELQDENGNSEIEEIQPKTDENGIATFEITNTVAEKVTYSVHAAGVNIGSIELEFLENEGVLSLGNNFPNPFRFDTSIPLAVPNSMKVKLEVFNSLGAPVRTLLNENLDTGYYEIPFNGADIAAGVYFYRLITDEGTKTGKMVLVK